MKVLSLLPLVFLVSCLSGKDSGSPESSSPGLSQCLCLDLPVWSVISKKPFPKNFMISYEGQEIVNTCAGRHTPVRESSNNEFTLKYQFVDFPKNLFQFELMDLGENCSGHDLFYAGRPNYSTAIVDQPGQKKSQQVYVYLD